MPQQHQRWLEIRCGVDPYTAQLPESGYSSSSECSGFTPVGESANRQFLNQLKAMGLDEVRSSEYSVLLWIIRNISRIMHALKSFSHLLDWFGLSTTPVH